MDKGHELALVPFCGRDVFNEQKNLRNTKQMIREFSITEFCRPVFAFSLYSNLENFLYCVIDCLYLFSSDERGHGNGCWWIDVQLK